MILTTQASRECSVAAVARAGRGGGGGGACRL